MWQHTVNSSLVSWAEYWVTVSLIQVSNSMQQAEAKKELFPPKKTKEKRKNEGRWKLCWRNDLKNRSSIERSQLEGCGHRALQ